LALVDISLPDGNGFTVCTELKETQDIPVLFLTASGEEASVVTGLSMGADDYIIKPFRPRELIARIKPALRKSGRLVSTFEIGRLSVDTTSSIVKKDGKEVFLSALEYRLLLVFINNPTHYLRLYSVQHLFTTGGKPQHPVHCESIFRCFHRYDFNKMVCLACSL